MPKTFQDFVADAKTRIQEVSPQDANGERGSGATMLDVREPTETARGVVPGAVCVPRGVLEGMTPRVLPDRSARILVYCAGGMRSALAADRLQEMGYTNVASVATGFQGWVEAGLPVAQS